MLEAVTETPVGGRRLRLARVGKGPPLVFLHGYPENLQIWCELVPRLADRYECIAFDWPGMGYSEPWEGGATPADQARRLVKLLDAWGIRRASVVGCDMGGQPALVLAADHPARVDRLIVMNSLVFPDEKTSWEIRVLRKFGWNRAILRRLPGTVFRRAEKTFLSDGGKLPAKLRADLWDAFRRREVRDFIIRLCAGYQGSLPRLPARYRKIARPALVLWGEADAHFPPVHAERLRREIRGSQLEILPAAGHWMAWDRAKDVAARIRTFLGRRDA